MFAFHSHLLIGILNRGFSKLRDEWLSNHPTMGAILSLESLHVFLIRKLDFRSWFTRLLWSGFLSRGFGRSSRVNLTTFLLDGLGAAGGLGGGLTLGGCLGGCLWCTGRGLAGLSDGAVTTFVFDLTVTDSGYVGVLETLLCSNDFPIDLEYVSWRSEAFAPGIRGKLREKV